MTGKPLLRVLELCGGDIAHSFLFVFLNSVELQKAVPQNLDLDSSAMSACWMLKEILSCFRSFVTQKDLSKHASSPVVHLVLWEKCLGTFFIKSWVTGE